MSEKNTKEENPPKYQHRSHSIDSELHGIELKMLLDYKKWHLEETGEYIDETDALAYLLYHWTNNHTTENR